MTRRPWWNPVGTVVIVVATSSTACGAPAQAAAEDATAGDDAGLDDSAVGDVTEQPMGDAAEDPDISDGSRADDEGEWVEADGAVEADGSVEADGLPQRTCEDIVRDIRRWHQVSASLRCSADEDCWSHTSWNSDTLSTTCAPELCGEWCSRIVLVPRGTDVSPYRALLDEAASIGCPGTSSDFGCGECDTVPPDGLGWCMPLGICGFSSGNLRACGEGG